MTPISRRILLALLVLSTLASVLPDAVAQSSESAIAAAKKRGRLIVGVKYDFPPLATSTSRRKSSASKSTWHANLRQRSSTIAMPWNWSK